MKIKEFISKQSLNIKLAGGTVLLGLIALIIGNPSTNISRIDEQDLAVMVEKGTDHISVEDLADWIIKGKVDYRLIDLRSEKEFAEYSIPSSENIQISDLLGSDLQRNEKIILCSKGGIHSVQAWFLLKAKGYKNVYTLRGGLDEWKDKILFPKLAVNAAPKEKAKFDKMAEVSKFFGGEPQTGLTEAAMTNMPVLPKLQMPIASPTTGTPKKKREGC